MANVEYFNPYDYPVSVLLPTGGTLMLREAKRPKDTHNIIPEDMVDSFGEPWFDKFTAKGFLHKRKKGFLPQVAAAVKHAVKPTAKPAEKPAVPVRKEAPAPKYNAQQVAAMNQEKLREVLDKEYGLTTEPNTPENQLRELLAEALGLGSQSAFV